jgi:hypothetical protein
LEGGSCAWGRLWRRRARTEDLAGAGAQREEDGLVAIRLHAQLVLLRGAGAQRARTRCRRAGGTRQQRRRAFSSTYSFLGSSPGSVIAAADGSSARGRTGAGEGGAHRALYADARYGTRSVRERALLSWRARGSGGACGCAARYGILAQAAHGARWLGPGVDSWIAAHARLAGAAGGVQQAQQFFIHRRLRVRLLPRRRVSNPGQGGRLTCPQPTADSAPARHAADALSACKARSARAQGSGTAPPWRPR